MGEKIIGADRSRMLTYLEKTLRLDQDDRREVLQWIDLNRGRWYRGYGFRIRRDEHSYTIETT